MSEPCRDCERLLSSLGQRMPVGNEYLLVPEGLRGGLARYFVHGIQAGQFLTAVLENDLAEACARADDKNRHELFTLCFWLYNHAPTGSWRSPANVREWLENRRSDVPCGLVR